MKNYWVLLLVLFSVGCSIPQSIVKLTPSVIENKDYWNLGQQFVYDSDKNVWVDCAFNRTENETMIFNVKVNNRSDNAILVSPAEFYQQVYFKDSLKTVKNKAFDPEAILESLKLEENIAQAQAQNAAIFSLCSATISTGAAIAVVASNKEEEKKEQMMNTINTSNNIAQNSAGTVMESSNVRAENNWVKRQSLAELFMRKTTLPSGYYLEGEVHFPYYKDAKQYEVCILVGNAKVTFLFKQHLIYPHRNNGE
jgi:uncharacterized protein YoaH (UPF0181 family)